MDLKRIFRGPLVWILVLVVLVIVIISLFNSSTGFKGVSTEEGLGLLNDGQVTNVKIVDGEQRVDLTLKADYKDDGKNVQFYYVTPRGPAVNFVGWSELRLGVVSTTRSSTHRLRPPI